MILTKNKNFLFDHFNRKQYPIMEKSATTNRPNFFNSDYYTEFFIPETSEVWVYGDRYKAIHDHTPRVCIGTSIPWDTSGLRFATLPVTDGHGGIDPKGGYIWESKAVELCGTAAHEKISYWYYFNA